jgi:hypothetical protein
MILFPAVAGVPVHGATPAQTLDLEASGDQDRFGGRIGAWIASGAACPR